jgi:hypothetical protein
MGLPLINRTVSAQVGENLSDSFSLDTGISFSPPDPDHIIRRARGWKVLPNGYDDHDNLEWALRNTESGGEVRLVNGFYKVGRPIVVADFDGTLAGAGAAFTTMTCTDEFNYELWESLGSPGSPPPPFPRVSVNDSTMKTAPVLIQFYKTPLQPGENPAQRANRIEIRNLRCRSVMIGEPWALGDEVLCFNIVNSFDYDSPEAEQVTTRQDVEILGVEVDGYRTSAFAPFDVACACITVVGGTILTDNYNLQGSVDGDALGFLNGGLLDVIPAEGNVTFRSCTFRNCRVGPGVVGYHNATIKFENITTDHCRGNCLQLIDLGNSEIHVHDCDLFCDSFLLPPELAGGAVDVPSSLGCFTAVQGMAAVLGYPHNVQWLALAYDPAAHQSPETGGLGTWRPRGTTRRPQPSNLVAVDNSCRSSETPNTYCFHLIDLANLGFASPTLLVQMQDNVCQESQTCISLEHVVGGQVFDNQCTSQQYGIELYNSTSTDIRDNQFDFNAPTGCEIRELAFGDKIDFSRVVPGAGYCLMQI